MPRCSPSIISELLSGKKNQSPYVPDIHIALNWTPPLPPVLPEETEELITRPLEQQLSAVGQLDEVGGADDAFDVAGRGDSGNGVTIALTSQEAVTAA